MITIATYKKTTKISPEGDERHFLERIEEVELDGEIAPASINRNDENGDLKTFYLDEALSKELGHYVYTIRKNKELTPFVAGGSAIKE